MSKRRRDSDPATEMREGDLLRRAAAGDLAAGVVHETRNLVTAIRGFAQVAKDRLDDPQELERILGIIDAESARATESLSAFLGFASGDRDGPSRLDVNHVVGRAARLVRHRLALDGVKLELALAGDLPPVRGDAARLQQVLVNLAFNARDAMEKGGVFSLATRTEGGEAVIEAADGGSGIDEAIRERIFEPYFSTKPDGRGAGLGLAIAARIVGEHGGTIDVARGEGGGAVFTVRIPAEAGDG